MSTVILYLREVFVIDQDDFNHILFRLMKNR